ncbi:MAG: VanZ family protein [Phycisphaeraceae bacterium]
MWLALIAYGGLIPFDFVSIGPRVVEAGGWASWLGETLTSPRWHAYPDVASRLGMSAAASDVLANLVLFAPVGVFLVWALPRHRWGLAWVRAVAVVALASWLLECTQSLSPSRVASLNDVVANTMSGALGATLAVTTRRGIGPTAFWLYRRGAGVRYAIGDALSWIGGSRKRAWAVAGTAGLAVAAASWIDGRNGSLGGWLPFAAAFRESYNVAAWRLGMAAAGYLLLLIAAGAPLAAMRSRGGLLLVLLVVAGWAVLIEIGHAARGRPHGPTGPILALAVATTALTFLVLVRAVIRRRCRRRRSEPVAVERRRRPDREAALVSP